MKIVLAAVELSPWVREGVSADTAAGLARGLGAAGIDAVVAVPDYPVFAGLRGLVRGKRRALRLSGPVLRAWWTEAEIDGLRLALVEKPEFFDRAGIYGAADAPYEDNFARFAFFARAVRQIAASLPADLIHGLDWPGALIAAAGGDRGTPCTLGMDNFIFQGDFSSTQFPQLGLPWEDFAKFEFYGRGNALKAGLLSAAATLLPGARMAHAVQSCGAGCGLEGVAASVAPRLHGILAGADYDGWLDARSPEGRRRKAAARKEWLAWMKLDPLEPEGLLVVCPLALCAGRGLDLLLPVLDRVLAFPVRLVVLGHPPLGLAPSLQLMSMRHGGRFLIQNNEEDPALRAACAAADATLLADASEAEGLRLAGTMRAGAVPLAQFCPGLHEIVRDHDPADQPGTGLVFYRHDPEALWDTLVRALSLRRAGRWDGLTACAAVTDFSWSSAGARYAELFRSLA